MQPHQFTVRRQDGFDPPMSTPCKLCGLLVNDPVHVMPRCQSTVTVNMPDTATEKDRKLILQCTRDPHDAGMHEYDTAKGGRIAWSQ